MRLRAMVRQATGKTKHTLGEFAEGKAVPVKVLPSPASVEISEEDGAFYLYRLDAYGMCIADTWHRTLEEAKRQATFEYGISEGEWACVPAAAGAGASG